MRDHVLTCGWFGALLILSAGRQATANVKESLEWGTKIVGGVKPGVEGEHLGLPIFPSVRAVGWKPVLLGCTVVI